MYGDYYMKETVYKDDSVNIYRKLCSTISDDPTADSNSLTDWLFLYFPISLCGIKLGRPLIPWDCKFLSFFRRCDYEITRNHFANLL